MASEISLQPGGRGLVARGLIPGLGYQRITKVDRHRVEAGHELLVESVLRAFVPLDARQASTPGTSATRPVHLAPNGQSVRLQTGGVPKCGEVARNAA